MKNLVKFFIIFFLFYGLVYFLAYLFGQSPGNSFDEHPDCLANVAGVCW